MFHFHKWETILRKRCKFSVSLFGKSMGTHMGLRVLDICTKCGLGRGRLVDSDGESREKVIETLFSDEEIRDAVQPYGFTSKGE